MNRFLWGVYPYVCATLFFVVPVIRMATRPFSWSTRASSLFNRRALGAASLLFHWGILLVLLGHVIGLFGGVLGSERAIQWFYWVALVGGFGVLAGSAVALYRRLAIPEVRAMSQPDDYAIHFLLIPIVTLALYQVVAHRIFGVAYNASSWFASLIRFAPQPELMASASLLSKIHVALALTFFAYFPFTKLVHVWTFPVNYFVRPYQSMRTVRYHFQRKWEFALRSDKSWLVYGLGAVVIMFAIAAGMLGRASVAGAASLGGTLSDGRLMGQALYVSQCARCHGVTGHGDGAGAKSPTFLAPPRDLTAGMFEYISTSNGIASDDDLRRTIRRGVPLSGMPAFGALSETQINSLVAVINEMWVDRPEAGPPIPIPPRPEATAVRLAAGENIFQERCAVCHGATGRGDGPAAANLPVAAANLAGGEVKAGTEPEQIFLRVAAGIPPYMPSFNGTLPPDSIWAVVLHVEAHLLGRL